MDKFRNKYRIQSNRLNHWDYSWNASYFITICTQNRTDFFGDIIRDEMVLSGIGGIVKNEWMKTPEIRVGMNIILDEFVVMPNHFHAIITIGKNEYNMGQNVGQDRYDGRNAMHRVSTTDTNNPPKNKFGPQSKNLASIIRGFKSAVTIHARKINPGFAWQSRYYDHIIRDDPSFQRIRNYIINNPKHWYNDKFNLSKAVFYFVQTALLRYYPDLGIVAFHRTGEMKCLQFLYRERESLNLGSINQ